MRVTDRRTLFVFSGLMAWGIAAQAMAATSRQDVGRQEGLHQDVGRQEVGQSCTSDDPDFLCLGMKYVVYGEAANQPVVSRQSVQANLEGINKIWNQCKIGFEVDEFSAIDPKAAGLPVETKNFSDLDQIRTTLQDPAHLLLVTTYKWSREGDLGHTPANAWTKMPGGGTYGVILEQKVGAFPNIIAHELGHYLNLYHAAEKAEVMNAVIYQASKLVTAPQCQTARAAVKQFWSNMLRKQSTQLARETSQDLPTTLR